MTPKCWKFQGKTPWVDAACADCPGFSGPGCCSSPGFHLRLGASDCFPALAFCFRGPWTFAWICCPQLPYHPRKTGRTAHVFTAQGGTRREIAAANENQQKSTRNCQPFLICAIQCVPFRPARSFGPKPRSLFSSSASGLQCYGLVMFFCGGAPKERRRRRAEKRTLQKGVFGESVSSLLP